MPKLINIPKPSYPKEAATKNISGKVVLSIVIDKAGNVANVTKLSGDDLLASASIRAAFLAKFKPSLSIFTPRQPVKAIAQVTFNFVLSDKSEVKRKRKGKPKN